MLLRQLLVKMYQRSNSFSTQTLSNTSKDLLMDYESTIKALNGLQTNAQYLKAKRNKRLSTEEEYSKTILSTQKYLKRSGVSLEILDTLPVIHVSGTKGKGTTCALSESILRQHGYKTGFYSSPHLIEVRERICINGAPISKISFVNHFWDLYNKLQSEKASSDDMPMYFQFLTLLAFRIFLAENVDVAVIEVGIGGEYDSTNILRNVPVAGVTSLGLDHTSILGNTLEEIAWHKSGIFKPSTHAFTVIQQPGALKVLKDRSTQKQCTLTVVQPELNISSDNNKCLHIHKLNVNLALSICDAWIRLTKGVLYKNLQDFANSELTQIGLKTCKWPGRFQIIRHINNVYYLDGAHTLDSIQVCSEWFHKETRCSSNFKVLLFNATGDRNSENLLKPFQKYSFDKVYFVPNKAVSVNSEDHKNFNTSEDQQIAKCHQHYKIWHQLKSDQNHKNEEKIQLVKVLPSVLAVLQECNEGIHEILITGSLHLVGSALSIICPDLYSNNNYG